LLLLDSTSRPRRAKFDGRRLLGAWTHWTAVLGLQLACPKLMAKGQAYPVASSIELKGHSTKNNARWPDAVAAAARCLTCLLSIALRASRGRAIDWQACCCRIQQVVRVTVSSGRGRFAGFRILMNMC